LRGVLSLYNRGERSYVRGFITWFTYSSSSALQVGENRVTLGLTFCNTSVTSADGSLFIRKEALEKGKAKGGGRRRSCPVPAEQGWMRDGGIRGRAPNFA
jgi:hypothetical protein